jgi:glucosylglycerate synthase
MGSPEEKLTGESTLSDEFVRELVPVGEVDLLVGICSFDNAKTIEHVVQAVLLGLAKYFPRERSVVVNADGGSTDGTPDLVRNTLPGDPHQLLARQMLRTVQRVSARHRGEPGSAGGLRTIVAAADLLRAKACAIVSPDVVSIRPEWIEALLRPVYQESFDLITPVYRRHKFDGLLITNLAYPLLRAAYGKRLREPVAGEFAFSGKLAAQLLDQPFWQEGGTSLGAELWTTTTAILGGGRLGQSFLGPRVHAGRDSDSRDLVAAIRDVVGTLFRCLEVQDGYWLGPTQSEEVSTFGFPYDVTLEPVRFNRKRMLTMFRTGVTELASILESILAPETLRGVQELASLPDASLRFPAELWARVIYDFASSYRRSVISRDHIVQALAPLYRGRVSSFVADQHASSAPEVEQAVEDLCLVFERLKPYGIERWNTRK